MNHIRSTITSIEDGKTKYDTAMKELFSNKQILARILQAFVSEFQSCSLDDIEHKYIEAGTIRVAETSVERNHTNIEGLSNEDKTLNEGNIYYDIMFHATAPERHSGDEGWGALPGLIAHTGMYINLELQNSYYPGYSIEARGTYYAARRFASQLRCISRETSYAQLQKIYSIWICVGDVPNYEANSVSLYRMEKHDIIGSVKRARREYDFINVIIIRINDHVKSTHEVLRLLQTLCSDKISKSRKLDILEQLHVRINDIRGGVERMCNLSDLIEKRAIEQGISQGISQGKQEMVIKLYQNHMSVKEIARIAELPLETVRQWCMQLHN